MTSLWTDFVRAAAKKSSLLSHLHVFCRSGNVWVKNAAIFTETGVSTGIPCLDLSILTNGLLRWQTRGTYYTFKGEVLCCAIFVDDRSAVSLIPFLATTFTELCQSSFCFRHDLSNNATLKQHCWFNVVQIFRVYLNSSLKWHCDLINAKQIINWLWTPSENKFPATSFRLTPAEHRICFWSAVWSW